MTTNMSNNISCIGQVCTTTNWFNILPDIFIITTLATIVLSAVIGNILVITAIYCQRRLRTVTNYYIVSLAWADLLVAVFVMPFHIIVEITGTWIFGVIFCDIWISMDVLLCTASILNLCCISLDRYFAITQPLQYAAKRSKRLCFSMIAAVWIMSALITCPPIFGWKDDEHGRNPSKCRLTTSPGYVIYSACGSFYIPLAIMLFVYARIFKAVLDSEKKFGSVGDRRRTNTTYCTMGQTSSCDSPQISSSSDEHRKSVKKKSKKVTGILVTLDKNKVKTGVVSYSPSRCVENNPEFNAKDTADRNTDIVHGNGNTSRSLSSVKKTSNERHLLNSPSRRGDDPLSHRSSLSDCESHGTNTNSPLRRPKNEEKRRERLLMRKESKIAKTLAIVVGCFVVCWLPFFLAYLIAPFCSKCVVPPLAESAFVWLGYVNSALNPIIYGFFNADFRKAFWKLTIGRCPSCDNQEETRPVYFGNRSIN
ncbi:putative G-protein coupled receptor No18 [Glandiceps talaboti]